MPQSHHRDDRRVKQQSRRQARTLSKDVAEVGHSNLRAEGNDTTSAKLGA